MCGSVRNTIEYNMKYIKYIFVICVFLFTLATSAAATDLVTEGEQIVDAVSFTDKLTEDKISAEADGAKEDAEENVAEAVQAEENVAKDNAAEDNAAEDEELDIPTILYEHIGDAYEWHITNIGKKRIAIPLPIIVHSSTGWHCFSSNRLLENEGSWEGLHVAGEDSKYAGKLVEIGPEGEEIKPLDISITKNVLSLMISSSLLVFLILSCAGWYRKHDPETDVPTGVAAIMEPVIMMVHTDLVKDAIGEDYKRYSPYLCTAFFFILLNNLLGIVPIFPGGANLTGNIAITGVLALCTFVAINFFGNKHYYKDIFWPDMPWWLKTPIPIMPVIEVFSTLTKPFSLMVRLFANMLAGHLIAISLVCMIFVFAKIGAVIAGGMGIITVLLGIFMDMLEILVSFVQAYVFTILSAIFIGVSRQKAEE